MTGDGKIGLQVSNVVRIGAVRRLSGHAAGPAPAPAQAKPADPVAAASLIGLASDIASQPAPVDGARVAAIRSAIAEGRYQLDPGATARAMLQHYSGGKA
ncbi:flagellar biosynthesis anti-sigma factor FlgM [Sphingopyxis sp. YF1]|jgi:negative regulator of flagellin synthesis FlgM|uniref:flagellar biosynthesis anti-sigma factor FlgM n=1 Tax=Sphingopyxis sp. YF1 TaxID=2482763 RepID=UPI001F602D33|nr:flagellar biosynthesis anti-sigma factor FlgM [Sphingopyxis sp. YF1]UNU43139.1 flagellar biosynthesis anti-sigma factor FlgM [Sphingopyxis sp. YF1]